MLIAVTLLVRNNRRYIEGCLNSVLSQSVKDDIELSVIDNNSVDGTSELIKDKFRDIRYFKNDSNAGYSKAHNIGIKASKSKYILILNADVYLTPTFIEEIVKSMESSDKAGMAMGKLYKMGGEGYPSGISSRKIIDSVGISFKRNRRDFHPGYGIEDKGQYDDAKYIFGAYGAAPMYRREMLEDVKINDEYLDEDFFTYREEADLAWRAQLCGWKCLYVPSAVAYHVRQYKAESRKDMPIRSRQLMFRNRYLMVIKNDLPGNFFMDLPYILWFEVRALLYAIFVEPFLLKAYHEVIQLFPKMLKKRESIMQKRKVSARYMRRWFR